MKKTRNCKRCNLLFVVHSTYAKKECCTQRCAQLFKSEIKLYLWLNGDHSLAQVGDGSIAKWAKRYLLEQVEFRCSKCCWSEINTATGNIPLEVDHIDGNWKNSAYSNLRILCPNCHALTLNYKFLNKDNKASRYSYYKTKTKK